MKSQQMMREMKLVLMLRKILLTGSQVTVVIEMVNSIPLIIIKFGVDIYNTVT